MFPARFFAAHFFAPRFFPEHGAVIVFNTPITIVLSYEPEWHIALSTEE